MDMPNDTDKQDAYAAVPGAATPRNARRRVVKDLKRQIILDAARRVFEKRGLLDANIRAIAEEAGYSPSAIYNHFTNKEAIYGDLLAQSLDRLNAAVRDGAEGALAPEKRIAQHALAFYDFYLAHPRDLDLGFYLFQGMRPLGLNADLNERLNLRLRDALRGIESGLGELGGDQTLAMRETTALFGHCVGLLLLTHTGRIRMFGQEGRELFETYLKDLIKRVKHG